MGIDKPPKKPSEIVIAASDSSSRSKRAADYVCNGSDELLLNDLFEDYKNLHLLNGIYDIRSTIIPSSNSQLTGEGSSTVLKAKNSINDHIINLASKTGVSISNIKLDGNKSNQTFTTSNAKTGILTYDTNFLTLENIIFSNMISTGLLHQGGGPNQTGPLVKGCFFDDCRNGISLINRGEYIRILGSLITNSDDAGILINGAGNVIISDVHSIWNTGDGVFIESNFVNGSNPGRFKLDSVVSNHNNKNGFNIQNSFQVTLNNCDAVDNDMNGVLISGSKLVSINGGLMMQNNQDASTYDEIRITDVLPSTVNLLRPNVSEAGNVFKNTDGFVSWTGGANTIEYSTESPDTGYSGSIKVVTSADGAQGIKTSPLTPATASQAYVLAGRVKVPSGVTYYARVYRGDNSDMVASQTKTGTGAYDDVLCTGTLPAGQTSVYAAIIVASTATTFYVGQLQLEPGSTASSHVVGSGKTESKHNIINGVLFNPSVAKYDVNEVGGSDYNTFIGCNGYNGVTGGINKVGVNSISEHNVIT